MGLYLSICLTLDTRVGMSLSVFLDMNVCRGGCLNLCPESPKHMYTVPSSGQQRKDPKTASKKAESGSPPIPDWSHGDTQGKVSRMASERAGEGRRPLGRELCAGSSP